MTRRGFGLFLLCLMFVVSCVQEPFQLQTYESEEAITMTLEVIRAFDERLPVLTDQDMQAILAEATRIISSKFSPNVKIVFHEHAPVSLDQLFAETAYAEHEFYQRLLSAKYDITEGARMTLFQDEGFQAHILQFLKQWSLDDLKQYAPDRSIATYEDVYADLMAAYHQKVAWLKRLKTTAGDSLLLEPLPPFQSYVEWIGYMWAQDRYDLIVTNALILHDALWQPYPHSIYKHAKIGGSSFPSPNRPVLDGMSLMVNILEDYGDIPEISSPERRIARELQNKVFGATYIAHELGHALYLIPDVYDHADSCVMNTSRDTMDNLTKYKHLLADLSPDVKCQPWIQAKAYSLQARVAYANQEYLKAGHLYVRAAQETPELIDGNYHEYVKGLYQNALDAFTQAKDEAGIRHCQQRLKQLADS